MTPTVPGIALYGTVVQWRCIRAFERESQGLLGEPRGSE